MIPRDTNHDLMDIMTKPSDGQINMAQSTLFQTSNAFKYNSPPIPVSNPIEREKTSRISMNNSKETSLETRNKYMPSNNNNWATRGIIPSSSIIGSQSTTLSISDFYGSHQSIQPNDQPVCNVNYIQEIPKYPWSLIVKRVFTIKNGIAINLPNETRIVFTNECIYMRIQSTENVSDIDIREGIYLSVILPLSDPCILFKYLQCIPKSLELFSNQSIADVCLVIELIPDPLFPTSSTISQLLKSTLKDLNIFENDTPDILLEFYRQTLPQNEINDYRKISSWIVNKLPAVIYRPEGTRNSLRLSKTSKSIQYIDIPQTIKKRNKSSNEYITLEDDIIFELDTLKKRNHTELFRYPFDHRPCITILVEDQNRLEPNQYLNDNIVDFYLMHLINTSNQQIVHVMNSFFFTLLPRRDKNKSLVDPFEKEFLVIPIHSGIHWYLAMVLWPKSLIENDSNNAVDSDSFSENEELNTQSTCESELKKCNIVIFDSLLSTRRKRSLTIKELRQYLALELMERYQINLDNNGKEIPCIVAKVPSQNNAFDCGVYLLHYVEKFLSDPYSIASKLTRKEDLKDWFPDTEIEEKRIKISRLIEQLSMEYKEYKRQNPEPLCESEDDDLVISGQDNDQICLIDDSLCNN